MSSCQICAFAVKELIEGETHSELVILDCALGYAEGYNYDCPYFEEEQEGE